ncbi:hypothetical protein BDP27DRAFT_294642 [Rhodocollybia butyracea]|uniref:mitogen-activated protein kinase kinase n=1 Tax=Rhodocollybia butyracea TaxID=206335 RepID=A0A9P5PB61_9AGAR|nr:hypothetical protein BDP27DRAFT_294642 [Rhodocollybia butyracea]
MAPEMFYPTLSRPSMATDVYAFGSTVLEIMTGMAPYPDIKNEAAVLSHVMSGCHPSRPSGNFSDELWRAIKPCWAVISDRPTISSFRRWHAPGHCWSTGL